MTRRHAITRELEDLIDQFLDDTLSDEGMIALGRHLEASQAVRAFFLDYCQLHIDLSVDGTVERQVAECFAAFCRRRDQIVSTITSAAPPQSLPSTSFPTLGAGGSSIMGMAFVLVLSVLVMAVCTGLWQRQRSSAPIIEVAHMDRARAIGEPTATNDHSTNTLTPVAFIASTNGCAWGDVALQSRTVGSGVLPGDQITLQEGLAEFRLASGVSLNIEGPAAIVLSSPTSLVLQHGRVTINVPWTVTDFKLSTTSCQMSACEAEFGVRAAGGDVDLHVFTGQVFIASPFHNVGVGGIDRLARVNSEETFANGAELYQAVVSAGRGVKVEGHANTTTIVLWHAAQEAEFTSRLPLSGALPIGRNYIDAVFASQPFSYWRFESIKDSAVSNECKGGMDLKIAGSVRTVGDSNNCSIEMGRPGSECSLYGAQQVEFPAGSDYSVEVWVKPSHVHNGAIVAMTVEGPPDENPKHAFFLVLCGPQQSLPVHGRNRIRYLHREPPSSTFTDGVAIYSHDPYSMRRWQHVVAVKEGPSMRLYIDGEVVASGESDTNLAPHLLLAIGQAGVMSSKAIFVGQLDEMAMYDHALSEEEIRRHFNAVSLRPHNPPTIRHDEI